MYRQLEVLVANFASQKSTLSPRSASSGPLVQMVAQLATYMSKLTLCTASTFGYDIWADKHRSRGCVGDHSKGIRYPGVSNGTNIWSKYTHSYICFKDDGVARRDVDTLPAPSDAATSINLNTVSDTSDSSTDPCIYFTSEINWRGVGEKFCVPNISCGKKKLRISGASSDKSHH